MLTEARHWPQELFVTGGWLYQFSRASHAPPFGRFMAVLFGHATPGSLGGDPTSTGDPASLDVHLPMRRRGPKLSMKKLDPGQRR